MGGVVGMGLALLAALLFIFIRFTGRKKEAEKCDDFTKGAAWFFTFIGGTFGLMILFSQFIGQPKSLTASRG